MMMIGSLSNKLGTHSGDVYNCWYTRWKSMRLVLSFNWKRRRRRRKVGFSEPERIVDSSSFLWIIETGQSYMPSPVRSSIMLIKRAFQTHPHKRASWGEKNKNKNRRGKNLMMRPWKEPAAFGTTKVADHHEHDSFSYLSLSLSLSPSRAGNNQPRM